MTTRDMTPAVEAAFASGEVRMLFFVSMDFETGMLYVNNSSVNLNWNGHTWLGVGHLGGIDPIKETTNMEAAGLGFRISGIPQEHIQRVLGTHYQGRRSSVWASPLTRSHGVIADPVQIWWGRLDTMEIELGETATIYVSSESRMSDWNRTRTRRYNHEDQQIDYPGDKGLEYAAQMVDKQIVWGN